MKPKRAARGSPCIDADDAARRARVRSRGARGRAARAAARARSPGAAARSRRAGRRATSVVTTRWRSGCSTWCATRGRGRRARRDRRRRPRGRARGARAADALVVPPRGVGRVPRAVVGGRARAARRAGGRPELADLLARLGLRTLGAFAELPEPVGARPLRDPGCARAPARARRGGARGRCPLRSHRSWSRRSSSIRPRYASTKPRSRRRASPTGCSAGSTSSGCRAPVSCGSGDRARRAARAVLASRRRAHARDAGHAGALAARGWLSGRTRRHRRRRRRCRRRHQRDHAAAARARRGRARRRAPARVLGR